MQAPGCISGLHGIGSAGSHPCNKCSTNLVIIREENANVAAVLTSGSHLTCRDCVQVSQLHPLLATTSRAGASPALSLLFSFVTCRNIHSVCTILNLPWLRGQGQASRDLFSRKNSVTALREHLKRDDCGLRRTATKEIFCGPRRKHEDGQTPSSNERHESLAFHRTRPSS